MARGRFRSARKDHHGQAFSRASGIRRPRRRAAGASPKAAAARGFSSASGIWRPLARGLGSRLGWAGLGWAAARLGWLVALGWAGLLPAHWLWLGWALGWARSGWAGLGRAGLGWAGLGWAGLGWAGLGWAGLGWAACAGPWLCWGGSGRAPPKLGRAGLPVAVGPLWLDWSELENTLRERNFKRQWHMESFRAQRRAARVSTKTAAAKAFSSASGIWRPGARGLGSGLGWAGLAWPGLGWGRALLGLAGAGLAGRLPSWAGLGCRLLWAHFGWTGLSWENTLRERNFKRQWHMESFRPQRRAARVSTKTAAAKAFSSASGIWRPGARGLGSGLGWAGLAWPGLGWGRALLGLAGAGLAGRLPSWAGLGCRLLWVGLGWTGLSWKIHCGQRIFKRQWFMASFGARAPRSGRVRKDRRRGQSIFKRQWYMASFGRRAFPRKRALFEERRSVARKGQWKEEAARGVLRAFL